MTVNVTYTVKFSCEINVAPEDHQQTTISDLIEAIDIPETANNQYVCGSFQVVEVECQGKRVRDHQKTVAELMHN